MEIYKNEYNKNEDESLWELHEIRHRLTKKFENMTINEINKQSKNLLAKWKIKTT